MLQTPRLLLRPFTVDDLDAFAAICGDPIVMRFYPAPWTRDEAEAFIRRNMERQEELGYSRFAVIHREDERLIGFCGLGMMEVDGVWEVELGYMLDRSYWGRGLAPEAAREWIRHAFEDLRLPRLISLIYNENTPSIRVAEKNGLTYEKDTIYNGMQDRVYSIRLPSADTQGS